MKQSGEHPPVRIVLVRPRNPLNIGAAARAMSNFGFNDLAVVNPYEPTWRQTVSAVGAEDLVLNARKARTLEEVVGDCQLVLGTTTVRNRRLLRPVLRLPELSVYLANYASKGVSKIALLFGSEKTGLTEKYLERCNAYITIPTAPATPSMNLSHAVAVCCYELSKKGLGVRASGVKMATMDDREWVVKQAVQLFSATGYLDAFEPAKKARVIRQTLLQWNLRSADLRLLHGILRHVLNKLKEKPHEKIH